MKVSALLLARELILGSPALPTLAVIATVMVT